MRSNHGLLQAIRTGGGEGEGSGGSIKASCNRNAAPRVNKSITRERGGGLAIANGLTREESGDGVGGGAVGGGAAPAARRNNAFSAQQSASRPINTLHFVT